MDRNKGGGVRRWNRVLDAGVDLGKPGCKKKKPLGGGGEKKKGGRRFFLDPGWGVGVNGGPFRSPLVAGVCFNVFDVDFLTRFRFLLCVYPRKRPPKSLGCLRNSNVIRTYCRAVSPTH